MWPTPANAARSYPVKVMELALILVSIASFFALVLMWTVLPGAKVEDAEARAAQIRDLVASTGEEQTGSKVVTVSIGVAHYPRDGSSAEDLLAEADRRMYQEKRGRNNSRAGSADLAARAAISAALSTTVH